MLSPAGRGARPGARRPRPRSRYPLTIPGEVTVPEAACAISAETGAVPAETPVSGPWPLAGRGETAVVDAACIQGPLAVRSRRPGDRFRPLGLRGRKKLQDFFVDRKVPRAERDRVPLVVDGRGRIVWVAGHAVAEEARVTDRTQAVVILRLKLLGGPG